MKLAGIWLCCASALALSACHRPQATAAHPPAQAQAQAQAATPKLAANDKAVVPIVAGAPAPSAASAAGEAAERAKPHPALGGALKTAATRAIHAKASAERAGSVRSTAKGVAMAGRPPTATLAAAGGASPPAAVPTEHRFSAEYASCLAAANGFTVARASCHTAELARQGARVDRAFNTVLATRSGPAKAQLLKDQRTWLELRDSECQQDAGHASRDVLYEGSCRLDMTVQRAIKLEQMES